ncbi:MULTISPECIES: hypothetical protein [unclassified Arthrobacter]|uniref:hypothetical protein n=1 Tax=unclassified Arthrobacter TaxID=235627 RepID=UPI003396736C
MEEADDADIRQLFDTNVFGAVDMINAVRVDSEYFLHRCAYLPAWSGYYSATKAALEGLSVSLL